MKKRAPLFIFNLHFCKSAVEVLGWRDHMRQPFAVWFWASSLDCFRRTTGTIISFFVPLKLTENGHLTRKITSLWSLRCPGGPEMTNVLLYSLGWRMSNMMACGNMKLPIRRWRTILLFVSALDKCDHFHKRYLRFHLFFFIIVALLGSLMSDSATPDAATVQHSLPDFEGSYGVVWRNMPVSLTRVERSCWEEEPEKRRTKKANGAKGVSFSVTRFHMVEALFKRPITL